MREGDAVSEYKFNKWCFILLPLACSGALANECTTTIEATGCVGAMAIVKNLDNISLGIIDPLVDDVYSSSDDFCMYGSNNDGSNWPFYSGLTIDTKDHHNGVLIEGSNEAIEPRELFKVTVTGTPMLHANASQTGQSGSYATYKDADVLDYVIHVAPNGATHANTSDCNSDAYRLTLTIDNDDLKQAYAGSYSGSMTVTVVTWDGSQGSGGGIGNSEPCTNGTSPTAPVVTCQ